MIPYDSPRELKRFLQERGFGLKKRFGQNFLINRGVRDRILKLVSPKIGDEVWEIGPGLGCMTGMILEAGARLRVFEIDHGFIRVLSEEFGGAPGFSLTEGDVVKTWKQWKNNLPDIVFGNLPYSAASAIIADFLQEGFLPGRWIFMLQREVAERMTARPGKKSYSSFSVLCRAFSEPVLHFHVSPGSFFPPPEVVSTVVELGPRREPLDILDRSLFLVLIRSLFASRRKTVRNNILASDLGSRIGASGIVEILREAEIDPECRGETLDEVRIACLANAASRRVKSDGGGR
jgi:16S rRNA (adenine1518-N6/adenine1519-N6)-dimethyltransferase